MKKKVIIKENALLRLVAILLLALALRICTMGGGHLETMSLTISKDIAYGKLSSIFTVVYTQFHLPLDYALRALWGIIFGFSLFSQRALSLLMALVTIFFTYLLGKEFRSEAAGLLAALILALMPFHIFLSDIARMYSLLILLSTISIYIYIKKGLSWQLFLANILLLSSHFFAIIIVAGEIIHQAYLLKSKKRKKGHFPEKAYLFLPVLLYAAYLVVALIHVSRGVTSTMFGWLPEFTVGTIISTLGILFFGYRQVPFVQPLLAAILILLLAYSLKDCKKTFLLWTIILSAGIITTVTITIQPLLDEKYLSLLLPVMALLISIAIWRLKPPLRNIIMVLVIALYLTAAIANLNQLRQVDSAEDIAYYVKARMNDAKLVILATDGYFEFDYFLKTPNGTNFRTIGNSNFSDSDREAIASDFPSHDTIYFAYKYSSLDNTTRQKIFEYLNDTLILKKGIDFEFYRLYEFEVPERMRADKNETR